MRSCCVIHVSRVCGHCDYFCSLIIVLFLWIGLSLHRHATTNFYQPLFFNRHLGWRQNALRAISALWIFESHISTKANIKTDKWTGYKPLKNEYNIEQIKSNTSDFFQMNTIIHQVKSWLRSVYSWMHEQNIERYLDEYSYRLNRSIYKQSIFDNLIIRMMNHKHIGLQRIKIST